MKGRRPGSGWWGSPEKSPEVRTLLRVERSQRSGRLCVPASWTQSLSRVGFLSPAPNKPQLLNLYHWDTLGPRQKVYFLMDLGDERGRWRRARNGEIWVIVKKCASPMPPVKRLMDGSEQARNKSFLSLSDLRGHGSPSENAMLCYAPPTMWGR